MGGDTVKKISQLLLLNMSSKKILFLINYEDTSISMCISVQHYCSDKIHAEYRLENKQMNKYLRIIICT